MAVRLALFMLVSFVASSSGYSVDEAGPGFLGGLESKDPDDQVILVDTFLISSNGSYTSIFMGSIARGTQILVQRNQSGVDPAEGTVLWRSPCAFAYPNESMIFYVDEQGSGKLYSNTLRLDDDGDLQIGASGNIRWSSNTSGRGVTKVRLFDSGTLALLNSTNGTVWKNTDYPSAPDSCVDLSPSPPTLVPPLTPLPHAWAAPGMSPMRLAIASLVMVLTCYLHL